MWSLGLMSHFAPLLWVGSQATFDEPPKGFWVAVPVVVRRIIVEAPPDVPDADPFARAVVNLAAAGVQRVSDIAELIGIEDLGFVNEVIRRLVEQKVVTLRAGVVSIGERGDDVAGAAGERQVWYGIQDSYSGTLWPRAATGVSYPDFDDDRHLVELGTPGRPARRNFWRMPEGDEVDDPNSATITHALIRHLSDVRTVGIKQGKRTTRHLALLGRPEWQPVFSARLAPGREEARLLVRLDANGNQVLAADPFEIGAWFELARWTDQLLDQSPSLHEKVIAWAERREFRQRQLRDRDPVASSDQRTPAQLDATHSSPDSPQPIVDRNTLLLSLADRLRDGILRAEQQTLGLSYDSDRDASTLMRRWALLGFRVPQKFLKPVAAPVERAAEGFPADLHTLFYAWTLLVDLADGQALARQAPDLPALLYANATGQTQTAIPDLGPTTALGRSLPTESRY